MISRLAVTANLSGPVQSPSQTPERMAGVLDWTRRRILGAGDDRPALIFAQETFPEWVKLFDKGSGYRVMAAAEPRWRVRSAIVYDATALTLDPVDVVLRDGHGAAARALLAYHDSYVQAAVWRRGAAAGGDIVVVSVHASPEAAEPDKYGWPGGTPCRRSGGTDRRWPAFRLWDSDYLLVTLAHLHRSSGLPLLVAGDFNESCLDDPPGETGWGEQYFQNAAALGLDSWLHDRWADADNPSPPGITQATPRQRAERPTRGKLQLDHVLTAGNVSAVLCTDPSPASDREWNDEAGAAHRSDHAPIWFHIRVPDHLP